ISEPMSPASFSTRITSPGATRYCFPPVSMIACMQTSGWEPEHTKCVGTTGVKNQCTTKARLVQIGEHAAFARGAANPGCRRLSAGVGELRSPGKLKHGPPTRRSRLEKAKLQPREVSRFGPKEPPERRLRAGLPAPQLSQAAKVTVCPDSPCSRCSPPR